MVERSESFFPLGICAHASSYQPHLVPISSVALTRAILGKSLVWISPNATVCPWLDELPRELVFQRAVKNMQEHNSLCIGFLLLFWPKDNTGRCGSINFQQLVRTWGSAWDSDSSAAQVGKGPSDHLQFLVSKVRIREKEQNTFKHYCVKVFNLWTCMLLQLNASIKTQTWWNCHCHSHRGAADLLIKHKSGTTCEKNLW